MIDRTAKLYPSLVLRAGAPAPETSHGMMLEMLADVEPGKRVLEVGCASGYMSQYLVDAGLRVTGVEINPEAATVARSICEDVVVADLDVRRISELFSPGTFDAIVFGDVLEHLREPGRVLGDARGLLAPDGIAVISIPNVAHAAVRLALLDGKFDYQNLGLLDSTHLRFFTLRTVRELCLGAGFKITRLDRTKAPLFSGSDALPDIDPSAFDEALIERMRRDPEHETLQFVIRAEPMTDAERTRDAVELIMEHEHERRLDRNRIAELEGQLDALRLEHKLSLDHIGNIEAELLPLREDVPRLRAEVDRLAPALAQRELELADAIGEQLRYARELVEAKDLTIERDRAIDALRRDQLAALEARTLAVEARARLEDEAAAASLLQGKVERVLAESTQTVRAEIDALQAELDAIQKSVFWRLKLRIKRLVRR